MANYATKEELTKAGLEDVRRYVEKLPIVDEEGNQFEYSLAQQGKLKIVLKFCPYQEDTEEMKKKKEEELLKEAYLATKADRMELNKDWDVVTTEGWE